MLSHDASSDPEEILNLYESGGLPKWVIRQCLEGNESTGYILNNQKLSKLLAIVANNSSFQDEIS